MRTYYSARTPEIGDAYSVTTQETNTNGTRCLAMQLSRAATPHEPRMEGGESKFTTSTPKKLKPTHGKNSNHIWQPKSTTAEFKYGLMKKTKSDGNVGAVGNNTPKKGALLHTHWENAQRN